MIWLVDDQYLSAVLRTGRPPEQLDLGDTFYTTGCWYVRLCQAVLGAGGRSGTLSAPFAQLPVEQAHQAMTALLELPGEIGLLSLRELGPVIGGLRRRHQLNALGMEALAAAVALDACVLLSVPSLRLEEALAAEGRNVFGPRDERSRGKRAMLSLR